VTTIIVHGNSRRDGCGLACAASDGIIGFFVEDWSDIVPEDDFQKKADREIALEKRARNILDVAADADTAEIKKAFWLLAMENHPDKHPGNRDVERRFLALLAAYEYLVKGADVRNVEDITAGREVPRDLEENPWKYFAWWKGRFY